MVAQSVCQCPHPLQVVEGVTVLVNSDAELDLANHTTLQNRSHNPLSQPGGKLAGGLNHVNVGTVDPAPVLASLRISIDRSLALQLQAHDRQHYVRIVIAIP